MIRVPALIALIALTALWAAVAAADPAADDPAAPDQNAVEGAQQANLAPNSPHDGFTATAALVGGLALGDGVGRGPGVSFRVGYRTGDVTETLELTGASLLHAPAHQPGQASMTYHNDDYNLMLGAQFHTTPSLWLRGATGLTMYNTNNPGKETSNLGGGVLASFGVAIVRTRHFMLTFEGFAVASVVRTKGLMVTTGTGFGFSYY